MEKYKLLEFVSNSECSQPVRLSLDRVLDQYGAGNKTSTQRPECLGLNPDSTCDGDETGKLPTPSVPL